VVIKLKLDMNSIQAGQLILRAKMLLMHLRRQFKACYKK